MTIGRPTDYSEDLADVICEQIADGDSLRSICKNDAMPNRATVFRWLAKNKSFSDQYARAREDQAESYADEITSIADNDSDDADVNRDRLRIDARKWVSSKLKPKKYGDRIQHANDPDNPLTSLADAFAASTKKRTEEAYEGLDSSEKNG